MYKLRGRKAYYIYWIYRCFDLFSVSGGSYIHRRRRLYNVSRWEIRSGWCFQVH